MEGVGDEVLLFGVATVVGGVMLYYAALHMFSLVSPPGSEGATTVSQVHCSVFSVHHAVCCVNFYCPRFCVHAVIIGL